MTQPITSLWPRFSNIPKIHFLYEYEYTKINNNLILLKEISFFKACKSWTLLPGPYSFYWQLIKWQVSVFLLEMVRVTSWMLKLFSILHIFFRSFLPIFQDAECQVSTQQTISLQIYYCDYLLFLILLCVSWFLGRGRLSRWGYVSQVDSGQYKSFLVSQSRSVRKRKGTNVMRIIMGH